MLTPRSDGRKRLGNFFPNKSSLKVIQRKNSYSCVGGSNGDAFDPETPMTDPSSKQRQTASQFPDAPKKNKNRKGLMSFLGKKTAHYEQRWHNKATEAAASAKVPLDEGATADETSSDSDDIPCVFKHQESRQSNSFEDDIPMQSNIARRQMSSSPTGIIPIGFHYPEEETSSAPLSPMEKDFEPNWISNTTSTRPRNVVAQQDDEVPFDVIAPCTLFPSSAGRKDTPIPSPQDSFNVCPASPDVKTSNRSSDNNKELDVIMSVTPTNPITPSREGYSNQFTDVSPLTIPPTTFIEPALQKETSPHLIHPMMGEGEETLPPELDHNSSCDAGGPDQSYSFDEQPTCESSFSIQEYMKENEDQRLNLYVDDIQETTFDNIVSSFYGNMSLKMLTIVRSSHPEMGDYRTPQEMKILFDAIRCLPNIQFLAVINVSEDDLDDLMDIMPTYRGVKLQLHLTKGTLSAPFLGAIAQAPNLRHLQLHVNSSIDLAILLKNQTIRDLRVISHNKFVFDDHHMQLFVDALARNETALTKLDLKAALSTTSIVGLAFALRFNKTIKSLKVSYDCNLGDSDSVVNELSNMLEYNKTITTVYNHSHECIWVSSDTKDDLISSMKRNGKIESFLFFQEDSVFSITKDLVQKANKKGTPHSAHSFMEMFEKYWSCGSLSEVVGCPDVSFPNDIVQTEMRNRSPQPAI